jgi:aquaporin Z
VGSKVTTKELPGARAAAPPRARELRLHPVEYALEALELGAFMLAACLCTTLLEHPGSPLAFEVAPAVRRLLIGSCMALTAAALIYSGWGKRSGAHMNPAVTLTFLRLGKISARDALGYVLGQGAGAAAGVLCARLLLGEALAHPAVAFVVTVPGMAGLAAAFVAELGISFGLMLAVLIVSNHPRHAHKTGLVAASLVAAFITFEAPLSGMSMNPARTLGSALAAWRFDAIWLYFVAPPLGMLLAAEVYVHGARRSAAHPIYCAKLAHRGAPHCIFRCRYAELAARGRSSDNAPEGATTRG